MKEFLHGAAVGAILAIYALVILLNVRVSNINSNMELNNKQTLSQIKKQIEAHAKYIKTLESAIRCCSTGECDEAK